MTKPIVAFRDFARTPNNKYNFPTFSIIYDLSLATLNGCAGQENGKTHFNFILLLVSTLLLESIHISQVVRRYFESAGCTVLMFQYT